MKLMLFAALYLTKGENETALQTTPAPPPSLGHPDGFAFRRMVCHTCRRLFLYFMEVKK
jgi:hypothetical protein